MFIGTLNIRTLREESHHQDLLHALSSITHLDVLCLQETRRSREDFSKDGYQCLFGPSKNGQAGVGFMVSKNFSPWITNVSFPNHRLGRLELKDPSNHKTTISIISCYAPTEEDPNDECHQFYDDLSDLIRNSKHFLTLVGGDFNAKLAPRSTDNDYRIGPHSLHNLTSENGEKLEELIYSRRLFHCNSIFKKPTHKRWTWRSPADNCRSEIDHFLSNRLLPIHDAAVTTSVIADTDHRLLRLKVALSYSSIKRATRSTNKPKRKKVLDQTSFETALQSSLMDCTQEILTRESADQTYDRFTNWLLNAAEQASSEPSKNEDRLSEQTKWHLRNRRMIINDADASPFESAVAAMTCRRLIARDLKSFRDKKLIETTERRMSLRGAKRALNSIHTMPTSITDAQGKTWTSRIEMENVVKTFYSNLYESTSQKQIYTQPNSAIIPEILMSEVKHAARSLKIKAANGSDHVSNEMLRRGGEVLWAVIAQIFTHFMLSVDFPSSWKSSTTVLLPKKANSDKIDNFRPISILSCAFKLFSKILLNRLRGKLEGEQPPSQAGFRRGFSTLDHIQAVDQVFEKTREFQIPLTAIFVDFRKAFDSVETWAVVEALQKFGVESHYIHVLKTLSEGISTNFNLFGNDITVPISRGVRQGDITSPILFSSALEMAFRNLNWSELGIKINGEHLSHLKYADDIVLFAHNTRDASLLLRQLKRTCEDIGLSINIEKTKWMNNKWARDLPIILEGKPLEQVSSFVYLGRSINPNGTLNEELGRRRRAGWAAYNSISDVTPLLNDKKLKSSLFNSCVNPALLYGVETWASTKADITRLAISQKAIERAFTGISLKSQRKNGIRSAQLRQESGIEDAVEKMEKLKHRWAGHICRQTDDRWTKKLTFWKPWGEKRPQGRPKTRWTDSFKAQYDAAVKGTRRARRTFPHWSRIAQDRDMWHAGIHAACRSC